MILNQETEVKYCVLRLNRKSDVGKVTFAYTIHWWKPQWTWVHLSAEKVLKLLSPAALPTRHVPSPQQSQSAQSQNWYILKHSGGVPSKVPSVRGVPRS